MFSSTTCQPPAFMVSNTLPLAPHLVFVLSSLHKHKILSHNLFLTNSIEIKTPTLQNDFYSHSRFVGWEFNSDVTHTPTQHVRRASRLLLFVYIDRHLFPSQYRQTVKRRWKRMCKMKHRSPFFADEWQINNKKQ